MENNKSKNKNRKSSVNLLRDKNVKKAILSDINKIICKNKTI